MRGHSHGRPAELAAASAHMRSRSRLERSPLVPIRRANSIFGFRVAYIPAPAAGTRGSGVDPCTGRLLRHRRAAAGRPMTSVGLFDEPPREGARNVTARCAFEPSTDALTHEERMIVFQLGVASLTFFSDDTASSNGDAAPSPSRVGAPDRPGTPRGDFPWTTLWEGDECLAPSRVGPGDRSGSRTDCREPRLRAAWPSLPPVHWPSRGYGGQSTSRGPATPPPGVRPKSDGRTGRD